MRFDVIGLFLGMLLVTYIPRMLPALFMDKIKLSARLEKFLKLIPYTAMSALIFPGILTVDESSPYIGLAGGGAALILAWLKAPVIVCVLAAIAVDVLLYLSQR